MKKRFLSLIIATIILILPICSYAYEGEETKTSTPLYALTGIDENIFKSGENIKRGEFVKALVDLYYPDFNPGFTGDYEMLYKDVTNDSLYYSYIKAAKELDIIEGNKSGFFYPERYISVTDALTFTLNLLNYKIYAKTEGGYPTGYLSYGKKTGLLKGIEVSENLTKEDGEKLLYNALFVDMVASESVPNDNKIPVEIIKGKNLLSERYNTYKYDATILDDGFTSLTGVSVCDGEKTVLKLNRYNSFLTVDTKVSVADYLGCRVNAYVKIDKDNGKYELLFFDLYDNIKVKNIKTKNIVNVTNKEISYEDEEDDTNILKINISKKPPLVLLNGVIVNQYDSKIFMPEDGVIRAVDNNGDGSFDVIRIFNFNYHNEATTNGTAKNLIVDKVTDKDVIISLNSIKDNLDLSENKANYVIVSDYNIKTIKELQKNDVLSIAKSPELKDGKDFYYIFVKRASVSGNLESVSAKDKRLTINGEDYDYSSYLTKVSPHFISNLQAGGTVEALLDYCGKISYISEKKIRNSGYGYLINAKKVNTYETFVNVKLFTEDGEFKVYKVSDKVLVDNKKCDTADKVLAEIMKRPGGSSFIAGTPTPYISRPVIYKLDKNNEISSIDTDTPNSYDNPSEGVVSSPNAYSSQTFIEYSDFEIDDDNALKAAYRSPRTSRYKESLKTVDGKFIIDNDTIIMSVPDIDTFGLDKYSTFATNGGNSNSLGDFSYDLIKRYEREEDEANYEILSPASLSSLYAYDIQGYNINPDTGVAGFLILRGRNDVYFYDGISPTSKDYPLNVFLEATTYFDEETGANITKIYYTDDGINKKYAICDTNDMLFSYKALIEGCAHDNVYNTEVKKLAKGDVIRVIKRGDRLIHLDRVFRISDIKKAPSSLRLPTNTQFMYGKETYGVNAFPNDMRMYYLGHLSSYELGILYPGKVSENILYGYLGNPSLGDVDLTKPSTYVDQYYTINNCPVITVTYKKDNTVKVEKGDINDIVTYEETNSFDDTSIVLFKHLSYNFQSIFVINYEK